VNNGRPLYESEIMKRTICVLLTIAIMSVAMPIGAIDTLKILVPANPGGGWDQTARNLAQAMQKAGIVKSVQVDNRGGGGGTIGLAQFINSAKGDPGQLLVSGLVMVGAIELNKSPVNLSQVTPIARLTAEYDMIVVSAASKITTLSDLIAQFKANPGSISWGGGSAGGVDHILVGMIAKAVGVPGAKINYIPYSGGGEANTAILGGHVTAGVSGFGEMIQHVKTKRLRALAVSADQRLPESPNIPTLKEQGIDVAVANWRGVFGPPGISAAQREELVKTVGDAVKTPQWQDTLRKLDWSDAFMPGDQFKSYVDAEVKRVAQVIQEIGLAKK
jgi:putative tricarboxylic transport membrane protein